MLARLTWGVIIIVLTDRIHTLLPALLLCLLLMTAALFSLGWPSAEGDRPVFRVTAPAIPEASASQHLDGLLRRVTLGEDDELLFDTSLAVGLEGFVGSAGADAITTGRERLSLLLEKNLPPEATATLDGLLEQYLDYHERIADLDNTEFERLTQAQHRVFGPERAQALFGEQMEMQRMMQMPTDDKND